MGRPLRFIPPGSVVEITTRTIQGRLLLRPSGVVNDLILGVLGRAQQAHGVEIHAFVVLSNHMHILATVRDAAQMAAFMAFVNGNIAREIGRLHGWRDRFWSRRYRAIVVADEDAQVQRLRYILENGVKEGLVATPSLWPGCSSVSALTTGAPLIGTWHDRADAYRARRRGLSIKRGDFETTYAVTLSPLPCWRHLSAETYRLACAHLVTSIDADAVANRAAGGGPPVGVERVLGANPHDLPAEPDTSPAPLVHASSSAARRAFRAAYQAFVDAYRWAASSLRRGERGVEFPQASFPPALPFVAAAAAV